MRRQYDRFAGPMHEGWLNETTGYGLTWWVSERRGETIFAHSGSVTGYTAFLAGNLDRKTGVAVLTNGNRSHKYLFELALLGLDCLEPGDHERQPPLVSRLCRGLWKGFYETGH